MNWKTNGREVLYNNIAAVSRSTKVTIRRRARRWRKVFSRKRLLGGFGGRRWHLTEDNV